MGTEPNISGFILQHAEHRIIGQTILITVLIAIYLRLSRFFQPSVLISISLLFLASNAIVLRNRIGAGIVGLVLEGAIWEGDVTVTNNSVRFYPGATFSGVTPAC